MNVFASFIKVSHPSPYHWITRGMFSIHFTKLTMNVSRFHVPCIQETEYRPHITCDGLLNFLEHCKHTGLCVIMVRLSANCLPKGPTNSARMRTVVTTALQRQYLQTEFILWICLVLETSTLFPTFSNLLFTYLF
jgi:hypothetical protein